MSCTLNAADLPKIMFIIEFVFWGFFCLHELCFWESQTPTTPLTTQPHPVLIGPNFNLHLFLVPRQCTNPIVGQYLVTF
jgi:hypothetical protein